MNLNNVIAKAQRLMLDENFNKDVERAARAHGASAGRGGQGGNDLADLDAAIFGVSSAPQGADIYRKAPLPESTGYNPQPQAYDGIQIVEEVHEKRNPRNSNLPAAIIESFEKTPYQGEAFDISGGALAGLNIKPQPAAPQRQVINEAPQYPTAGGAVNYDLIKYIVNEAVTNALKGRLNESVDGNLRGMRLAKGNVLQFLDSNGNLFEAKLTLKKKAEK